MAGPQFPLGVQDPAGRWISVGDKFKTQNEALFSRITQIEYTSNMGDDLYVFSLSDGTEVVVEVDQNNKVFVYRQPQ